MAVFYLIFLTSKLSKILSLVCKFNPIVLQKLMGQLCFLILLCSVIGFYNNVFLSFVGFLVMKFASNLMNSYHKFGCEFSMFWSFGENFYALVMLFVFLGFLFLQFRIKSKQFGTKNDENCVKNSSFDHVITEIKRVLCKSCGDQISDENNEKEFEEISNVDEEIGDEDKLFDVMSLRKMVKFERQKANAARNELEKERMASSSSVNEAMTMIMRLQNEKSALKIRVNQLERSVDEKQLHDQEVVESLQMIIMKLECEKRSLYDQLKLCREKLKGFIKDDEELNQFDSSFDHKNVIEYDDVNWSPMEFSDLNLIR